MALTGQLSVFNFADIMQVLGEGKKDGVLVVDWKDLIVAYYVKGGEIIFAYPVDKVYRIYVERNFDRFLEKLRIKKEVMPKTVERFLLPRLSKREGVYSFNQGFVEYSNDYPVKYHYEEIIMRTARTLSLEEAERKISTEDLVFEKAQNLEEKLPRVSLLPQEKTILSLIDGNKKVRDLRSLSEVDELTLKRSLYGFLAGGLIKRKVSAKRAEIPISQSLLAKIIERIKGL